MEKISCQELCSRTQKQIEFMSNYCRSKTELDGMLFVVSKLDSLSRATSRQEYLDKIFALTEEVEVESKSRWGFFHQLFGFDTEWKNGAISALDTAMSMLRSAELKDGKFHPDGFPYPNYLAMARREAGIDSID